MTNKKEVIIMRKPIEEMKVARRFFPPLPDATSHDVRGEVTIFRLRT